MASIVYQTDKKTGAKYAYESVSYWDKEKKQPRSKRKYLGRVDPETGKIIRKSDSVNSDSLPQSDNSQLLGDLKRKDKEITELKAQVSTLRLKYNSAIDALTRIEKLTKQILEG